jgi:spore coat protein A, manganese oxidase
MKNRNLGVTIVCVGVLLGAGLLGTGMPASAQSPPMAKWVDPLPVPPVAVKTYKPLISSWADYYEINMTASQHQFFQSLSGDPQPAGPATVWTYGQPGKTPVLLGPTIVATSGRPVVIKYINQLPTAFDDFPLKDAIDPTIAGWDVPTGAAIPHLHGGHTAARFDGTPMQWWTADGLKGMDYKTDTFTYLNDQPAALMWYHDHTMGATRFKPYLGLAAAYLIVDDVDNGSTITVNGPGKDKKGKLIKHVQKVPAGYGQYHLPLVIQDKQFNADGTLFYPTEASLTHDKWVPEFFGDTPVINGKAYPYLDAEPRRYRLRLLNGSQARFYNLHFNDGQEDLTFYVIGSEGGLLPAPAAKTSLLVAPGERFDVIVDFTGIQLGSTVMMINDANAPYPDGDLPNVTDLLKININQPLIGTDNTVPPADLKLPAVARLCPTPRLAPRDVVARENMDAEDNPSEVLLNGYHFMDPTTDIIKLGTTETWQWINLTVDAHPMHPHLVAVQVVDRQMFDVETYKVDWQNYLDSGRVPALKPDVNGISPSSGLAYLIGPPIPPEPEEMGFKDTVKSPPGYVTRTRATFTLGATSLLDYNWKTGSFGDWVYHCHILEHEENDMMRPFRVIR